jgi:hypothetical protein
MLIRPSRAMKVHLGMDEAEVTATLKAYEDASACSGGILVATAGLPQLLYRPKADVGVHAVVQFTMPASLKDYEEHAWLMKATCEMGDSGPLKKREVVTFVQPKDETANPLLMASLKHLWDATRAEEQAEVERRFAEREAKRAQQAAMEEQEHQAAARP